MLRKKIKLLFFGRRKVGLFLLLLWSVVALGICWWLAQLCSRVLLPPPGRQDLRHFRHSRSLKHYLDDIQLLVEPSSPVCQGLEEIALIVLVSSSPANLEQRQAVRKTWGQHLPTYFVLGLNGPNTDEQLVNNYIEAKQHGDIIVYDFKDHYQNLTLKTALMMHWTLARCPQAEFLFKTDDDVLVNPWTLKQVVKDNIDAKLIGYKRNNTEAHRDEYNKWFLPRWLFPQDSIAEYLSGTGYIINGEYLKKIFKTAYTVPLINTEDVYFTYLVVKNALGLKLSHDYRLSPYKPWLPIACVYWELATAHSMSPNEMIQIWPKIAELGRKYMDNEDVCSFYRTYFVIDLFLY